MEVRSWKPVLIPDSGLSQLEKRAILANWASDARAVEGALRFA
jgi:hypothetical protein